MTPEVLAQIPQNLWWLILLAAIAVAAVVFTLVFVFIVDRKYGREASRDGSGTPQRNARREEETEAAEDARE